MDGHHMTPQYALNVKMAKNQSMILMLKHLSHAAHVKVVVENATKMETVYVVLNTFIIQKTVKKRLILIAIVKQNICLI